MGWAREMDGLPTLLHSPLLPVTKMLGLVLLLWGEECGFVQELRGLSVRGWEGRRVNRLRAERCPEEIHQQRKWCRGVNLWIWELHNDYPFFRFWLLDWERLLYCVDIWFMCICVWESLYFRPRQPDDIQSETHNVEQGFRAALTLILCHPFCQNSQAWVHVSISVPYREGEFDNLSFTDWQSILPNIWISKLIKKKDYIVALGIPLVVSILFCFLKCSLRS